VSTFTRRVSQVNYFSWRLTQGKYRQGFQTRLRRLRGVFDEENPSDMTEYHATRDGVDQDAIVAMLTPRFEEVSLLMYWSAQAGLWQRFGERLRLKNTFGVVATGYRG
jgi:hypothetical protein